MGCYFSGCSIRKSGSNYEKISNFDPNPTKFIIKEFYEQNGNTAIFINYPNCINYEGNKIIIFKDVTYEQIKKLKELDPHFTEESMIKPFARFEPTIEGWLYTKTFLNKI